MTVPFVVVLLVAIGLELKLRGHQWPGLILGVLLANAVTPGSMLDQLGVTAADAVETILVQVLDAFGQSGVI